MTDGVTPRCLYCGDPLELAEHMQRLDANQAFLDWMHDVHPDGGFRANTKCEPCRSDPDRAIEMMSRASTEELRARMRGLS